MAETSSTQTTTPGSDILSYVQALLSGLASSTSRPFPTQPYSGSSRVAPLDPLTGRAIEDAGALYGASPWMSMFGDANSAALASMMPVNPATIDMASIPRASAGSVGPIPGVSVSPWQTRSLPALDPSLVSDIRAGVSDETRAAANIGPLSQILNERWTPQAAAYYASPYTDSVIDRVMRELNRTNQIAEAKENRALSLRGNYGGAADVLAETERERNLMDKVADATAELSERAYENARNQFNTDVGRDVDVASRNVDNDLRRQIANTSSVLGLEKLDQDALQFLADLDTRRGAFDAGAFNDMMKTYSTLKVDADQGNQSTELTRLTGNADRALKASQSDQQALLSALQGNQSAINRGQEINQGAFRSGASLLGNLGSTVRDSAWGDLTNLARFGDTRRGIAQTGINAENEDFWREFNFPVTQAETMARLLYGAPSSRTTTGTQQTPDPNQIAQWLGGGLSLASLLRATGAFSGSGGTPGWLTDLYRSIAGSGDTGWSEGLDLLSLIDNATPITDYAGEAGLEGIMDFFGFADGGKVRRYADGGEIEGEYEEDDEDEFDTFVRALQEDAEEGDDDDEPEGAFDAAAGDDEDEPEFEPDAEEGEDGAMYGEAGGGEQRGDGPAPVVPPAAAAPSRRMTAQAAPPAGTPINPIVAALLARSGQGQQGFSPEVAAAYQRYMGEIGNMGPSDDFFSRLGSDPLLAAGAAMLANTRPDLGGAIGQGLNAGSNQAIQNQRLDEARRRSTLAAQGKALDVVQKEAKASRDDDTRRSGNDMRLAGVMISADARTLGAERAAQARIAAASIAAGSRERIAAAEQDAKRTGQIKMVRAENGELFQVTPNGAVTMIVDPRTGEAMKGNVQGQSQRDTRTAQEKNVEFYLRFNGGDPSKPEDRQKALDWAKSIRTTPDTELRAKAATMAQNDVKNNVVRRTEQSARAEAYYRALKGEGEFPGDTAPTPEPSFLSRLFGGGGRPAEAPAPAAPRAAPAAPQAAPTQQRPAQPSVAIGTRARNRAGETLEWNGQEWVKVP